MTAMTHIKMKDDPKRLLRHRLYRLLCDMAPIPRTGEMERCELALLDYGMAPLDLIFPCVTDPDPRPWLVAHVDGNTLLLKAAETAADAKVDFDAPACAEDLVRAIGTYSLTCDQHFSLAIRYLGEVPHARTWRFARMLQRVDLHARRYLTDCI
jgi:hypothetical protein